MFYKQHIKLVHRHNSELLPKCNTLLLVPKVVELNWREKSRSIKWKEFSYFISLIDDSDNDRLKVLYQKIKRN